MLCLDEFMVGNVVVSVWCDRFGRSRHLIPLRFVDCFDFQLVAVKGCFGHFLEFWLP